MKRCILFCIPVVLLVVSACMFGLVEELKPPQVSPIFSTQEDFTFNPGDSALFWVEASDPNNSTLRYLWTLNAGEILGSAQRDSLHWKAPLGGGNFPLAVRVSNADSGVTVHETVMVRSFVSPYVKISEPKANDFLVQFQPASVKTQAYHGNGISQLQLWVNNSLIITQSGTTAAEYEFTWNAVAPAGKGVLKVVAISQITLATGADSVQVSLEGVIRGKKKSTP
jgi:hypothetical protein